MKKVNKKVESVRAGEFYNDKEILAVESGISIVILHFKKGHEFFYRNSELLVGQKEKAE